MPLQDYPFNLPNGQVDSEIPVFVVNESDKLACVEGVAVISSLCS